MRHPTYKHIEGRIRLGALTLPQWAQLFVGAVLAFGLSKVLPLPGTWALSVALTVVGIPVGALVALGQADISLSRFLLSALRFRRGARRYRPGADPRHPRPGYIVHPDAPDAQLAHPSTPTRPGRADLWD